MIYEENIILEGVLVMVAIPVKRHHDHDNTYEGKYFMGGGSEVFQGSCQIGNRVLPVLYTGKSLL